MYAESSVSAKGDDSGTVLCEIMWAPEEDFRQAMVIIRNDWKLVGEETYAEAEDMVEGEVRYIVEHIIFEDGEAHLIGETGVNRGYEEEEDAEYLRRQYFQKRSDAMKYDCEYVEAGGVIGRPIRIIGFRHCPDLVKVEFRYCDESDDILYEFHINRDAVDDLLFKSSMESIFKNGLRAILPRQDECGMSRLKFQSISEGSEVSAEMNLDG